MVAQQAPVVQDVPLTSSEMQHRPRIGLVLGGGGALGLTEVGVLRWFEENHIPVDVIAGTSMGCMLSAFYATGYSSEQIQAIATDRTFAHVFRLDAEYNSLNFRRRQDDRRIPGSFTFGLKHGLSLPRSGVLSDTGLNDFLAAQFLRYGDDRNFNSLPIPLRCVATDLARGELHVFRSGSLAQAVRASISLPGVFPAEKVDDHMYVDGALLQNLPVETEKDELKPDKVIAVSIPLEKLGKNEQASLFGVLGRSFSVASWANEQRSRKLADIVISPEVKNLTSADYTKSDEMAKIGYDAAQAMRDQLLPLRVSDPVWAEYVAHRQSLIPGAPKFIRAIDLQAPSPAIKEGIARDVAPLVGQPLKAETIDAKLDDIRNDRRFNARYSVTHPGSEEGATVHLKVTDRSGIPPALMMGVNFASETGPAASQATLEMTFLHQDLGGYHSELRGKMAFGYNTLLELEYYKRLDTSKWFLAPRGNFYRTPIYIYTNQKTVAQRTMQQGGVGLDAGYSFSKFSELRFGWEGYQQSWKTKTGSDGLPDTAGFVNFERVRYEYNAQDRAAVPHRGLRAIGIAGVEQAGFSETAPKIMGDATYFYPATRHDLVSLGVSGGTFFHRKVDDSLLFTLGGPLRLTASAINEYRGTDYWLVRPMFMRRIAQLPAPLGQSFYITGAYEAGQMYSPYSKTITRQDFFAGFVAETPLGVLSIGPSFGDHDEKKLVFTLGRFF